MARAVLTDRSNYIFLFGCWPIGSAAQSIGSGGNETRAVHHHKCNVRSGNDDQHGRRCNKSKMSSTVKESLRNLA